MAWADLGKESHFECTCENNKLYHRHVKHVLCYFSPVTLHIFYFGNLHLEGFLLFSDQLPLYLECNFNFNLPHHAHAHKQIKPLVHSEMERANIIPCCQTMNRWCCVMQDVLLSGNYFPRFGLASPMSENGKKGLERPHWLFIPSPARGGGSLDRHVWGSKNEMSLLGQGYEPSPEQVRFEAGSSDTKHPQEDSWNLGLEVTSKAFLTRPRCKGKTSFGIYSYSLTVVKICWHVGMIIFICSWFWDLWKQWLYARRMYSKHD